MAGWHHRVNGHEFEQALGVGDGQGGLACCSPWGRKESDTTERLNNNNNKNKGLLYSTGNYIQYPMISHNGKEYQKNAYVYI